MSRLVVLRPEPGASETLERAKARGLDAVSISLFELKSLQWETPDPGGFDALLLTSANAVRLAGEQVNRLRGLPVHAVGAATADAARGAGFDIASSGEAGVERLLSSIEADLKLLHLCGEDRAETSEARQSIAAVPVYRSQAIEPAPRVDKAVGAVVMIHSPRAAKRFAELSARQQLDRRQVALVAISAAGAEAAGEGWKAVKQAGQPTDDALLALAEQLCENWSQQ